MNKLFVQLFGNTPISKYDKWTMKNKTQFFRKFNYLKFIELSLLDLLIYTIILQKFININGNRNFMYRIIQIFYGK